MEVKTKKIIIDFGVRFTKVGFEGDSEPRKILATPSLVNLEDYFEEKTTNYNILSYLKNSLETKLQIEEFACYIINDVLQIFKTDSKFKLICFFYKNNSKKYLPGLCLRVLQRNYLEFGISFHYGDRGQ